MYVVFFITSNVWLKHKKTQMEINTYNILPFFKISRTHAWKMIPSKKYPLFRENKYKHDIRFDRGRGWV